MRLGAWIPFEAAGRLLADFMGLGTLSEPTVRRHTEAAGAAYVTIQEQAVENVEQAGQPGCPVVQPRTILGDALPSAVFSPKLPATSSPKNLTDTPRS